MIQHRIQARLSKLSKYFCNINIFRTKWLIARSHEYIFLHQLIFYPGTVPLFAYQHSDTIRADRSGGVLLSTSLPALPAPKITLRSSGIITGTCHINHARNDASIGVRVPSPLVCSNCRDYVGWIEVSGPRRATYGISFDSG